MNIAHTSTKIIKRLPAHLLFKNMEWVVYKAGEVMPNGRLASEDYDMYQGFARGVESRRYPNGYQAGLRVPDYFFACRKAQTAIEITGSLDGKWMEKFVLEFKDTAERDQFFTKDLGAMCDSTRFSKLPRCRKL